MDSEIAATNTSHLRGLNLGLVIFIFIMIAIGPFLNAGIIGAILKVKSLNNPVNMFIINLCSADLLLCLVIGSASIVGLWKKVYLKAHPITCRIICNICITVCVTSICTHTVIAVVRYVKIRYRTRLDRLTKNEAGCICIAIWIVAFFLQLPINFFPDGIVYEEKAQVCFWNRQLLSARTYLACLIILPLMIIAPIYWKLKDYLSKSIKSKKIRRSQRNMVKIMMIHFAVVFFAWGQFAAIFIVDRGDKLPGTVYAVSVQLAHSISVLGPMVYWLFPGFKWGIWSFYTGKHLSQSIFPNSKTERRTVTHQ